jgi:hypothetical protein
VPAAIRSHGRNLRRRRRAVQASFVVYDLGDERIYKYEVSLERSVTEIVPVDKDVRVAFDALVTANQANPELVRAGRLRIQMPATLSNEPAESEQ